MSCLELSGDSFVRAYSASNLASGMMQIGPIT